MPASSRTTFLGISLLPCKYTSAYNTGFDVETPVHHFDNSRYAVAEKAADIIKADWDYAALAKAA